jgi:hypothetical protein
MFRNKALTRRGFIGVMAGVGAGAMVMEFGAKEAKEIGRAHV